MGTICEPAGNLLPGGLKDVTAPVQLWIAERDELAPDSASVRTLLPPSAESHVIPLAGHFAFLAPCNDILATHAPEICDDPPGFDRRAFLAELHARVIAFFKRSLSKD